MLSSKIAGIGKYLPSNVVTNQDLAAYMETSDEWIVERTGIKERRYAHRTEETTTTMAVEAAKIAIERAGTTAEDIDFIVFATLSPDYYFPGCGVLVQRAMGMKEMFASIATPTNLKRMVPIPEAGNHVMASPIQSNDIVSVEKETALFLEQIMQLKKVMYVK